MILNGVAGGQVYGTSYGAPTQFSSPASGTTASAPSSTQSYADLSGAQSLLSAYSAGPSDGSQLADQQVGYGHYVGQGIDKMDARAEKMLDNGKISQSQYQQVTQISQSVSQQQLQDDANDNGQKLSKSDFTDARAALATAHGIL